MSDLKALVVESDLSVATQLVVEVKRRGIEARHVTTASQAYGRIDGEKLHAVLVALDNPGVDGEVLVRRVRRSGSNAGVPLVVMTSNPVLRSLASAAALGASHFLVKPLGDAQVPQLLDRIESWMRAERRHYQRAPVSCQVLCAYGRFRHLGSSINLSPSGILLALTSPLAASDEVELTFPLEAGTPDPFVIRGRVARVEDPDKVAVAFRQVHGDQLDRLRTWVELELRGSEAPLPGAGSPGRPS